MGLLRHNNKRFICTESQVIKVEGDGVADPHYSF